jgi:plastocyanin
MRFARFLSVALLSMALVAACGEANGGWVYVPASPTPVPSASGSAAPSGPAASTDANLVMISALGVKFEQATVTAPAGKPFKIQFENKDPGTPHNVAIHEGSATGKEVYKGEVFPGPASKTYDVPAIAAGSYAFICTVHPTMTGTMTVQ